MMKLTLEQRIERIETEIGLEKSGLVRTGSIYDDVSTLKRWFRAFSIKNSKPAKKWYQFWK